METLAEKKEKLFGVIDGYIGFLDRLGGSEYKKRKEDLLSERSKIQRDRYQIALIGYAKRGKSTLLNALLGDSNNYNLSPVNVDSCTAAIIKYKDTALYPDAPGKEGAIIYFNDDSGEEYIDIKEISRYVNQEDPDFKKSHAEKINHIDVYGSFPLIETRGIFVDTPGMGALYDQNNLTMNFLPHADIILCPIAADLPLDTAEIEFLAMLPPKAQEKLLFLLTKADTLDDSELDRTLSRIGKILASMNLGKRIVYPVYAKKVMAAYIEGKSSAEIEQIKQECGIKELEGILDQKLRSTSSAARNIKIICNTILKPVFDEDINRFAKKGEDLRRESGELEEKRKNQEIFCNNIKTKFDKNTKNLEREWNKAVRRFITKLETYEGKILNALTDEVDNKNLLSLMGFSKKMARNIQSRLKNELEPLVYDFQDQLTEISKAAAQKLDNDINDDIEIYAKYSANGSLEGEIKTLIGGGIAAGGAFLGTSSVVGALGTISAAAAGSSIAAGEAAAATASAGWFGNAWAFLFGGKTAATAGAAAAAQGALVTTLIGAVIPILGGAAIAVIAYKIGTGFAKNQARNQIPKMVAEQLKEAVVSIEEESRKMFDYVLGYFRDHLDTLLTRARNELEDVIQKVKDLNAEPQLVEIERNIRELEKLSLELTPLINSINSTDG